ncbi:MAG: hypothetical protein A2Z08_03280 [Deltaproteobacteria bacterium RBG_16_54_11]|nr:MAG: hypothetical protein A2Z08_03280 [Deltaproteobacteria bacterium RBG_16_54_11]
MNYKNLLIILFITLIVSSVNASNSNNDEIEIKKYNYEEIPEIQIISGSTLEEWKYPGRYSVLNVLNNDNQIWATRINSKDKYLPFIYFHFEREITVTEGKITSGKNIQLDLIDSIIIKNGHNKSESLYSNNIRAKTLKVYIHSTDNHSYEVKPITYTLKDNYNSYQKIDLKDNGNKNIVGILISFQDFYPSKKYNDLCISYIGFIKNNKILKFKNSKFLFLKESKEIYKNKFLEFINAPDTNFAEMTDKSKEANNLLIIDKNNFYLNSIKSNKIVPNEKGYLKKIKYKFEDNKLFLYINNNWRITNYECVIEDTTWEIPLFLYRYKAVIFDNEFLKGKFYIDEYGSDDPERFNGIKNLFKETHGFY